jgi:hypothetical protein
MPMARKITTYTRQTPKCGEVDRDRGFNDPAPSELNCTKCRGKGTMIPTSIDTVGE